MQDVTWRQAVDRIVVGKPRSRSRLVARGRRFPGRVTTAVHSGRWNTTCGVAVFTITVFLLKVGLKILSTA